MKKIFYLFLIISCSTHSKDLKYKRSDYKHWIDSNRDCQNTRQEILIERSEIKPEMNKKGCKVVSGLWSDYYYPEKFTKVRDVDIDHLVPLKHAHMTGAQDWSRFQKQSFANDPENLVITSKKYNRAKGSKGIDKWLPINIEYACKYVKDWVKLKSKYKLNITSSEQTTLDSIKTKCQ